MSSVDQLREWVNRATNSGWAKFYADKHGVPEILAFEHLVHHSCVALHIKCQLRICPYCKLQDDDTD